MWQRNRQMGHLHPATNRGSEAPAVGLTTVWSYRNAAGRASPPSVRDANVGNARHFSVACASLQRKREGPLSLAALGGGSPLDR